MRYYHACGTTYDLESMIMIILNCIFDIAGSCGISFLLMNYFVAGRNHLREKFFCMKYIYMLE